ncbi:MAG: SDR family NAD(P)-dependent oxidoreductase [bacterium]|nr:SDR family NAD(P)-dependent oxidoreductase [bacterium]
MAGSLDGKVAAITAGSTGIGFGIAKAFLAEGASVVIASRSPEKGANALERLNAGDRAIFTQTDALVRTEVDAFVDKAVSHFGTIDILVNNAGGCDGWALIDSLSDEAWQKAFDWNCSSAFWGTRRALATMVPKGSGRIINMSSIEGKLASKVAVSHYIMGKHALNGLTKATAMEYAQTGITCNAICPGPIETEMMQDAGAQVAEASGITYEAFLDEFAQDTLTKKLNTVEQVAGMAVLLAGPLGVGMTGTLFNVDGGTSPY